MDEALARQLVRQLKVLNFWIRVFGVLVLATLAVLGYLTFKIFTFVNDTRQQISDIKDRTTQTLDVQQRLCDTKAGGALLEKTDACN